MSRARTTPRDTENSDVSAPDHPQNIFRVLIAGFALVILLLVAAAIVGIRNIQSIQENAADLGARASRHQPADRRAARQQTTLAEVFSVLARDPDSVDYDRIMAQLDQADHDIDRISAGRCAHARAPFVDAAAADLPRTFRSEARRLLDLRKRRDLLPRGPVPRSRGLHFGGRATDRGRVPQGGRRAGRRSTAARRDSREASLLFGLTAILLALVFAVVTVRMVSQLIRGMEWQTAELGRVSWHMLEDQEATARRFSHELHDELGQSLTAVKTNLAALDAGGDAESRARSTTACAWWTRPSATCARCRNCCAPPFSTISDWRPACAGCAKASPRAPASK